MTNQMANTPEEFTGVLNKIKVAAIALYENYRGDDYVMDQDVDEIIKLINRLPREDLSGPYLSEESIQFEIEDAKRDGITLDDADVIAKVKGWYFDRSTKEGVYRFLSFKTRMGGRALKEIEATSRREAAEKLDKSPRI